MRLIKEMNFRCLSVANISNDFIDCVFYLSFVISTCHFLTRYSKQHPCNHSRETKKIERHEEKKNGKQERETPMTAYVHI